MQWLDALPERFSGAVVANEVLDVMPVHLLVSTADGLAERGVAFEADTAGVRRLCWANIPAAGAMRRGRVGAEPARAGRAARIC